MFKFCGIYILYILWIAFSGVDGGSDEMMQMFMNAAEACVPEVGASSADVNNLMNGEAVTTKEGKCLHACIMKTFNLMDNDGKFVKAVALEHAKVMTNGDAEMMKMVAEIIDICSALNVSNDHCEASDEYTTCFKETAASRGIQNFTI